MKNNTDFSERLTYVIDNEDYNKNNFSELLGYKRSQTVYDLTKGKVKPSFDFITRFINSELSVKYNIEWLLTGNGAMLKSEKTDNVVMESSADYQNKSHTDKLIEVLERENENKDQLIKELKNELLNCKKNKEFKGSSTYNPKYE